MITRRTFLTGAAGFLAGSLALATYAVAIEPLNRLVITRYRLTLPGFPAGGPPLSIAVLADLHACDPWMPRSRIDVIVATATSLQPDLILLAGDYVAGLSRFKTADVPPDIWAAALGRAQAPLGVFAILGNHDWWQDPEVCRRALAGAGIPVLENEARRLTLADGSGVWLAGLGDQLAFGEGPGAPPGVDDLPGTLAQVTDDAPIILLAHEPDIFPQVPDRVALTLCGHTHGGQVNLPFVGPLVVPSRFGTRYAYGEIMESDRTMIVSGGLGCSILPIRLGRPPEIVLIEIAGVAAGA